MSKKIILSMLIIIFVFVLTGCNNENKKQEEIVSVIESCPSCVYSFYTEKKILNDSQLIDYTKNYTSLKEEDKQMPIFLGHILGDKKKIEKAYVCLTNDNETFCLEGVLESDSRKEEVYNKNKEILSNSETYKDVKNKKGKKVKKCYDLKTAFMCNGDISVYITDKGYVSLKNSNNMCYIDQSGTIICKKN